MKKKFLINLSILLSLISISFFTANANHLNEATIAADCNGFTLTISGATYKTCTADYSIVLTPADASQDYITATGSINLPVGHFDGYKDTLPVVFNGVWDVELCGDYTLSGSVTLNCENGDCEELLLNEVAIVDCQCVTIDFCPRTPGYWKNHPESWPVDSLTIGGVSYSQAELLKMLKKPVKGDIHVIFIKHIIAAQLNVISGSESSLIAATIMAANNYFAEGTVDKDYAESLKDALDAFNNSGDCD